MEIGGTQINAIELARTVAELGHESIVFGPPGDITHVVEEFGLEFVSAPPAGEPPAIRTSMAIWRLARRRKVDLIHAHYWTPAVEAAYGGFLTRGVPTIATIYTPEVPRWALPRTMPIIVGPAELAESERGYRPRTYLLEPPVDTVANAPVAQTAPARARFGLGPNEIGIFVVCRLTPELKREGMLAAARVMGKIANTYGMRLFIVGDGPSRAEIQAGADRANLAAGREVVTLTGQMADPRDAYAASDIMLGMGGSALRAMAFGKPLVVQGERGYWRMLTPESLDFFLDKGWYWLGDGSDGAPALEQILVDLMKHRDGWAGLGALGREVIVSRFSLGAAGRQLVEIYQAELALRRTTLRRVAAMMATTAHMASYKADRSRAVGLAVRPVRALARRARPTRSADNDNR
jgi:glycosyltransferase involved in cell wall biosynthesis